MIVLEKRFRSGPKSSCQGIGQCTRYALANAYRRRIEGNPAENIEKAIEFLQAARYYRAALSVVDAGTRPQLYCFARYGLGFSLLHQARLENNRELLDESLEAMAEALKLVSAIHSEIADPKARRDYLRRSVSLFDVGVHFMLEERRYAEALYWLEQMRSRSLLEDVNLEQVSPRNDQAAEPVRKYWELCHDLRGLRAALATEKEVSATPGRSSGNPRQQELYASLKEHLNRQKVLLEELTVLDPDYINLIHPEPLTEAELFELLSQTGSAAVECFFRRESADLHFLLAYPTDSGIAYEHILKDLKPILLEEALGGFVDSFRTGGASILPSLDTLLEVTGQLMQPVAAFLSQIGTRRIYLSPHAFLHAFPSMPPSSLTRRGFSSRISRCAILPPSRSAIACFAPKRAMGRRPMALFYAPADRPLPYGEQEFQYLFDTYGAGQVVPLQGGKATFEAWSMLQKLCEESFPSWNSSVMEEGLRRVFHSTSPMVTCLMRI